jgi:alpha-tubulin suppressor-like RCC1 family protein
VTGNIHTPTALLFLGSTPNFTRIAAGPGHNLGITTNTSSTNLWGWGWNPFRQIINTSSNPYVAPVNITDTNVNNAMTNVSAAAAGGEHSAVIRNGELWTFGRNHHGQLGDNTTTNRLIPTRIRPDLTWRTVAAGERHTIAITQDGRMFGWGTNAQNQLGLGAGAGFHNRLVPTQIGTDTDWLEVSVTEDNNIAMKTDGTVWIWGTWDTNTTSTPTRRVLP